MIDTVIKDERGRITQFTSGGDVNTLEYPNNDTFCYSSWVISEYNTYYAIDWEEYS